MKDSLGNPLESANIIAFPEDKSFSVKYTITDGRGRYRIKLFKKATYDIRISYLGYKDVNFKMTSDSDFIERDITLFSSNISLDEVTIDYEYKPIIIKQDTTVYNVSSFASGNERKMKEVLNKIPGIEVDKNGTIQVNGKKVSKLLVENKPFFGGNSKLAVENIPADALDKIEVLKDYNEVGFLKGLSDNNKLALNVKLKENKKKFVFGDIESGIGNDEFYKSHIGSFYYAPKINLSYIGDLNNIGESTFTFDDLLRFGGGINSFIKGSNSINTLTNLIRNNSDVALSRNQFSALNLSFETSKKLNISGYVIFSKLFTQNTNQSRIQYLLDSGIVEENRQNNIDNRDILGIGDIKLDYKPTEKSKWIYNGNFQLSNNQRENNLITNTNNNETFFNTSNDIENISFKQFVEWHKSINSKNTTSLIFNQAYDKSTPENTFITDGVFLSGLLPLIDQQSIIVNQIKEQENHSLDALFKYYLVINDFNHLYSNLGISHTDSFLLTEEIQLLDNNMVNNFNDSGFGNEVNYNLTDLFYGLEYKFKIGKFIAKPGLYLHYYQLNNKQQDINTISVSKLLLEPEAKLEYNFSKSEALKLNYGLFNQFPQSEQLADRFTLQSFNSIFRGNGLLENERFHNLSLRYNKTSLYRGVFFFTTLTYNRKNKSIRNVVDLEGINQFTTPILTNNPETNVNIISSLKKKIYRFNLDILTRYNFSEYLQSVNNIFEENQRTNLVIGTSLSTAHKKLPYVKIGYEKSFNIFNGSNNTRSQFETNKFNAELDYSFLKSWSFQANFESFQNINTDNRTSNTFNIGNASLRYQKNNSAWAFEISITNFLNNSVKNNNSFSDFTINERTTFILPRIALGKVIYKL